MTPNYCVLDDIMDRLEPKSRFYRANCIPLGLCKTVKDNWYAIAQLLPHDGTWLATAVCEIWLKKENFRSVNDLLAEACDRFDVPYENLIGLNVTASTRDTCGGEIITVDSLEGGIENGCTSES